jgi:integrase/recombinase XerC
MKKKKTPPQLLAFSAAYKTFMGYLEGSGKSVHTIESYRSDLNSFHRFLEEGLRVSQGFTLDQLTRENLDEYHDYLRAQGARTNTRRRKLLTVRRFFRFMTKRKKLMIDIGDKLPAPYKLERVPQVAALQELLEKIQILPKDTALERRNRILLWALAELGSQVSEISKVRFDDWKWVEKSGTAEVSFSGKSSRKIPASRALFEGVMELQKDARESPWVFLGYNKHGSLGGAISPRGVEILVKGYASHFGIPDLTPRMLRHSAVVHWYRAGVLKSEIQERLGLRTDYAFRAYGPLFKHIQPEKPLSK